MIMPQKVEARLVDNWRSWWKRASVWLAGFAGVLSTVIVANQGLALALLAYLPGGFTRTLIAVCIGIVVFVVPTIAVLWKQKLDA